MEELLLKLIEEVRKTYKDKKAADLVFKRLFAAAKGSSDYTEAYEFAKRAGHDLEDAIIENWAALMQDSEVFASTAKQLLKGVVPDMNEDILKACEQIQDNKNAAAGMRIKPQTAVANPYDLNTIAKELDGKKMSALDGELATHACKTVDSTERANMDFAMSSGYEIKVKRTYDGVGLRRKTKYAERCSYCLERAGSRKFKNSQAVNSSGIFARHEGCGCTIDYENTSTGTKTKGVQNYKTAIKKTTELRGNAESVAANLKEKTEVSDITKSYLNHAESHTGKVYTEEERYGKKNEHDVMMANWLADTFSADVTILKPVNIEGVKTPDFLINQSILVENKKPTTPTAIDDRIRSGCNQIENYLNYIKKNPAKVGLSIDISERKMSQKEAVDLVIETTCKRMKRDTVVFIKDKDDFVKVLMFKKRS